MSSESEDGEESFECPNCGNNSANSYGLAGSAVKHTLAYRPSGKVILLAGSMIPSVFLGFSRRNALRPPPPLKCRVSDRMPRSEPAHEQGDGVWIAWLLGRETGLQEFR